MKTFDKLVIREWAVAFLLSFSVLLFLVFMADFIAEYLRAKSLSYILTNFLMKLPDFLGKLFPTACLLGTLFSLSKLKNRNELVALFSSGWGIGKLYVLVCLLSLVVGGLQLLNFGVLAPWGQHIGRNLETQDSTPKASLTGDSIWYKGKDYFMAFAGRDPQTQELKNVKIYSLSNLSYLSVYHEAESAQGKAE